MPQAVGVAKQLRFKKESTWGTAAGASGAQILRRVTSDIDLRKDTYQSNELRTDYQINDFRHGKRGVAGTIRGELSPGTYQALFAAALRAGPSTAATTGAINTVTAAVGPPGTFTRSSGSFLTDGFRVGDIVRWTGWATTGVNNNARNYRITALSAAVMTVTGTGDEVVAAKAAGDSVTCTVVCKKIVAPSTGHTDDSFTIEHRFSDIAQSEYFTGCKVGSIALSLPPTGMATIEIGVMGKDMTTGTSAYFTSPTAATTQTVVAAVNGVLRVGGVDVANVTGLTINLDAGMSTGTVVGSNTTPGIFPGPIQVSGQMTAYFEDAVYRDAFLNETEMQLIVTLETSTAINTDFVTINLPRIKFGGASKSDGPQALQMTLPFVALLGTGASGTTDATTIVVQDSQFV
jgi:hypothetical protein